MDPESVLGQVSEEGKRTKGTAGGGGVLVETNVAIQSFFIESVRESGSEEGDILFNKIKC